MNKYAGKSTHLKNYSIPSLLREAVNFRFGCFVLEVIRRESERRRMKTARREFIKAGVSLAGTAAGLMTSNCAIGAEGAAPENSSTPLASLQTPASVRKGDMLYRQLGRTGQEVSLIGLGGFHIGKQATEAESIHLIRSAIDHGITFLDNSWDYNEGQSEIREGKALQGRLPR